MEMPQEIVVWYLIPTLRKQLVLELQKFRLSQKDIAQKMHITEAAVSQYIHNKRGSGQISLTKTLMQEVGSSAKRIMGEPGKNTSIEELIRLVKLSQKEKIICGHCAANHKGCDWCTMKV